MVASRRAQNRAFDEALAKWSAQFQIAALAAIRQKRASVSRARLEDAIRSGSYVRIVQIANELEMSETQAVKEMDRLFMGAYEEGAVLARTALGTAGVALSFDLLDPRAVEFMRRHRAAFIVEINEETRKAISDIVTNALNEGGGVPKQARKIHEVIGLTQKQAGFVTNFRRQLEERRNFNYTAAHMRRLSAAERARVKRHMRVGHLAQGQIDEMVETYRKRLERLRAQNIARTETMRALNEGQEEQWRQAILRGDLDPTGMRRLWITAGDSRVRDSHADIPRMNPDGVPFGQPFQTPNGPTLMPPPYWSPWNCRCRVVLTESNNPPASP